MAGSRNLVEGLWLLVHERDVASANSYMDFLEYFLTFGFAETPKEGT
jgi:hypothetical protein